MTALALFAASFAVVFLLCLQQLNIAHRHMLAAFATSMLISTASLVQFKLLPGPTGALEVTAYVIGSALGVVASMAAHPYLVRAFRGLAAAIGRP